MRVITINVNTPKGFYNVDAAVSEEDYSKLKETHERYGWTDGDTVDHIATIIDKNSNIPNINLRI